MKIPASLRWKAVGTIGSGGQATVEKVEDKQGEHRGFFALKGLPPGKPAKAYERFAREVAAIQRLRDPSIVRIIDHSISPGDFNFYVMEFIEDARPLKRVLGSPQSPFALNAISSLNLFVQLVEAIQKWWGAGIVHRDLSPGNILILPDNSIKVIDFGICQIEGNETITLADEGVGTQNYMAPECESGASGDVTEKSDLYSAGKILWSCVSNAVAFSRESPAFTAKSMSSLFPALPESWHLHHVFERTIRHSPADRDSVEAVLSIAQRVRSLITAGFPPLESLDKGMCPSCGFGKLTQGQFLHMVFGNPNPQGISSVQCDYCGCCFAINYKQRNGILASRAKLS